jgi:hypothetical protein
MKKTHNQKERDIMATKRNCLPGMTVALEAKSKDNQR